MEYYSVTKRNEIDSVEMWMDLGSVIQCELSQKKKNKCILTHICMCNLEELVQTNLFPGQE